ncbi:MAG: glycosyltransferase [Candidatus Thermoplasmatota archaeon]|nr:glycosyltransferase family 4 protein [Euryarchaeota archaeon]MBU4031755.1 glycosyltransferase [Candidatus Thermoplasmatota archaeon]MBU4070906.1 glycosyltransferase [Candidatus Thermoplasmatota archaeon]MBU4144955.1 glycosyltransferase [Candidatus Thermoplasmatota archaeon]MBU4591710.1 glycosyltransferase [Candidatus Thermoplasmatota archaeon]
MRVLHVHQIAHIPQLLVSRLKEKGVQADFVEVPDARTIAKHDIIHGHYALNRHTIAAFRLARKLKKPFILHCHGSDLRLLTGTGRKQLPFHYSVISQYIRKRSAAIILSTPDLEEFEPNGTYIPNPVDLERFRPMPEVKKSKRQLILGKQVKNSKLSKFIKPDVEYDCVNNGYPFNFPSNVRMLPCVEYDELNEFLNHYEFMIGTVGDVISMARLEAMACGLATFTDFEKKFTKYYDGQNPDEVKEPREFIKRFHSPEIPVSKLLRIYDDVMRA